MIPARYRTYLLVVLCTILASNYLDRMTLGLVLEDIRKELSLSDTQLGLLTGIAFALFHAVLGIPIARWADRGNRVTIISITAILWGAAMALCGAAANFVQLLITRIFTAVGEAGCQPPALSLISDH
jgi:MFS transporter, Spinster family, sphingosine-1-phosphate transporter